MVMGAIMVAPVEPLLGTLVHQLRVVVAGVKLLLLPRLQEEPLGRGPLITGVRVERVQLPLRQGQETAAAAVAELVGQTALELLEEMDLHQRPQDL